MTMNLWNSGREVIITILMAVYLIVITVLMAKEINSFKELKYAYFQQFWIYIDWTLFAFAWSSLPIYVYKLYALHDLLNHVAQNQISYINLSSLTGWSTTLSILLASCTFIATIKLIRLLRFDRKLSYLTSAIRNSCKNLISFTVILLVLFVAYSQLMFIIYNERTLGYATFLKAMENNFLIILGKFNLTPIVESNFSLGAIIFATYNILIVFVMVNVLIAIVSESFSHARIEAKSIKEISLATHLLKRFGDLLPSNKAEIKPDDYVSYSGTENLQSFEMKVTTLIDNVKGQIDARKHIKFDEF